MAQKEDISNRLRAVANELLAIADSMSAPERNVRFPEAAVSRMATGKCLNCERKPSEISVIRRGLCQACYQKSQRMLVTNPLIESELISKGLLAPSGFNPNAERTPLDEILRSTEKRRKQEAEAEADVARLEAMVAKRRRKKRT